MDEGRTGPSVEPFFRMNKPNIIHLETKVNNLNFEICTGTRIWFWGSIGRPWKDETSPDDPISRSVRTCGAS